MCRGGRICHWWEPRLSHLEGAPKCINRVWLFDQEHLLSPLVDALTPVEDLGNGESILEDGLTPLEELSGGAEEAGALGWQWRHHEALDGTFCRINDCKLSYGPLDCRASEVGTVEEDTEDVLTAERIAEATRCAYPFASCARQCSLL